MIAYDVTNGESFVNTKRWIEEVKNNCGDDGVPIVLVGNKCDSPNKVVSLNDQQEYARLMNLQFFETSAKDNINVDEVFIELTRLILARQERNGNLANGISNNLVNPSNGHIDLRKKNESSRKKCCN